MKSLVIIAMVIYLVSSQRNDFTDGRYYPDNTGAYVPDYSGSYGGDDGRYHPDDSGRYVPDNSGLYSGGYEPYRHQEGPFGSGGGGGGGGAGGGGGGGRYNPDGSGRYTGDYERYRHQEGPFGSGGRGTSGSRGGSKTYPSGSTSNALKPIPKDQSQVGKFVTSANQISSQIRPNNQGNSGGSGRGTGVYDIKKYDIVNKVEEVQPSGYHFLYETENKIFGEELGRLDKEGTKDESILGHGYYEYTGDDGIVYRVDYEAGENGFVPQAAHLPTPPPIPEAILRALEYQKSIGELK